MSDENKQPATPKPAAVAKPSLFSPVASKPKSYSENSDGKEKRG